jgi:hypothetical protein
LDISILVKEFNESMEAVKATSNAVHHAFNNSVISRLVLHLLINKLEYNTDNPNDGKDESTEGK